MPINPLLAAAIIEFVVGGFIFITDDHVAIANRGAAVVDLGLVKTTGDVNAAGFLDLSSARPVVLSCMRLRR